METRNVFFVEDLDFLCEVEEENECSTPQQIEEEIKDWMQEEIQEGTEEETEEEIQEEIQKEKEKEIEEETEEEIEEETEEEIDEVMEMRKTFLLDFELVSVKTRETISAEEVEEEIDCSNPKEVKEEIKEKIQEVIEEEIEESYTPNYEEFEESSSCDGLHSDLQKDQEAKAALEKELRITRVQTEMKEARRKKRNENHALSKALKKEQVEKDRIAHLRRSEKDHQHGYAKLQKQMSKMTADLKEKDGLIEKFKAELKGNSEVIYQGQKSIKELKHVYETLFKMKRKFLEQDNEIQSLHISTETLQKSSEAKSNTISMLQEKVDQWASDLKEERAKNDKLQKDLEAARSQPQWDKEELIRLTRKNQKLALEQKRLRGELEDDHTRQLAQDNQWTLKLKQEQAKNDKLQKDLEAALSQTQRDKEELIHLTRRNQKLALEQKRLRGELEDDHTRQLAQDNQWTLKLKQEQGKNNKVQKDLEAALSQQQKDKEELMLLTCKNHQLALDKKRLQGEIEDVQHKREISLNQPKKDRDTCNRLEEELRMYKTRLLREIKQNENLKKASAATESQINEDVMAKFEAKDRSESTARLAQLEDALHKETVQRSILEERTILIASALERERERANQTFSALERERERAHQTFSALEKERATTLPPLHCRPLRPFSLYPHTTSSTQSHGLPSPCAFANT